MERTYRGKSSPAYSSAHLSISKIGMHRTHCESIKRAGDEKAGDEDLYLVEEKIHKSESCETGFDTNLSKKITNLEQALKKEHAARAALYLELERERNAAATDEAMGMILRLQKEKASIEMEARQFRSMIEEKFAYDEEEINILKEILVRREREKLVLEKELEGYRQMMVPAGGKADMSLRPSDKRDTDIGDLGGGLGQKLCSSLDNADDLTFILQHISESIEKKETIKDLRICMDNSPSGRKQGGFHILPKDAVQPAIGEGIESGD